MLSVKGLFVSPLQVERKELIYYDILLAVPSIVPILTEVQMSQFHTIEYIVEVYCTIINRLFLNPRDSTNAVARCPYIINPNRTLYI